MASETNNDSEWFHNDFDDSGWFQGFQGILLSGIGCFPLAKITLLDTFRILHLTIRKQYKAEIITGGITNRDAASVKFSPSYSLVLRGKDTKWQIPFKVRLCASSKSQWSMKNPKRIRALRPSVRSYRHFTETLASDMIYINKLNCGTSIWNFVYK